jgi:RNA 3'-terminal phosphate cyclase (ATP)
MIEIDGSLGEGGGQVLRTSLALSLVTGQPFHIANIRARRKKPGLLNQHLTSVNAAAQISQSDVNGNVLGSSMLFFSPHGIKSGSYHFDVGTAGSCTLVLQTILPALLLSGSRSNLVLEGGTHNPMAPPFDFFARTFLPVLNRMGARVSVILERPGFYPAGGGRINVVIDPARHLSRIDILDRGEIKRQWATAMIARLPRGIAERELAIVQQQLRFSGDSLQVKELFDSRGPGNVLIIEIESEYITEIFTSFGERGLPAEKVAQTAVQEVGEYLAAGVPVGKRLADQLLIPLALAGGGAFRTLAPTSHARTNVEIVKRFLNTDIAISSVEDDVWDIEIMPR